MRWLSSLLLLSSTAMAEEACTLPDGFAEGFMPSFRASFDQGFIASLTQGVLQNTGIPSGWEATAYGEFTRQWWSRELQTDRDVVGQQLGLDALNLIETGPLCEQMGVFEAAQPDPVALEATMSELRVAMMPLMGDAQRRMQERLPAERIEPLTQRFKAAVDAATPLAEDAAPR